MALYRAHTPALFRMAWRMGGVAEHVDDAVQETWLRAARTLERFRFQSALRTWLISILVNCLHEFRRRQARSLNDVGIEVDAAEPAAPRETPHLQIDLERAVALLPSGMRDVFVLHDVEGLTHEETAEALGVTAGTSKSQLFSARRRLRATLAPPSSARQR